MIGGFLMNWTVIQQALPIFARGFELTLWLSLIGIVGSIIVGIIVSLVQYFKLPVLSQISTAYVELARNTPLLIQLFFLYYAFPVIGLKMSAEVCGIIGLIFLGGAYMAGKALGMNNFQLARYVVFPQGFSLSMPALTANIIFLIKETSIFSVIAIPELTNTALDLIGMYYRSNEYLLMLVVAYAIILIPVILLLTWLERRVRYASFGD